jgi:hypothetical protein
MTRLQVPRDVRDIISGGDQRQVHGMIRADLREADRGDEPVADALPSRCVAVVAAFADKIFRRFCRATIAERPVFLAISMPEITEVTEPGARGIGGIGERARELHDLEWKTRGRRQRIGEHARFAFATELQDLLLEIGADAGFGAEREGGADLNSCRAKLQSFSNLSGSPYEPASQNGRPSSRILSRSGTSRGP